MSRPYGVVIGLALLVASPIPAQEPAADSAAVAEAVAAQMERWLSAYERQDPQGLAEIFIDDGIYAANTGQVLRGRDGIRTGVAAWFAEAPGLRLDLRRSPLRLRVANGAVHDLSRFTIHPAGENCVIDAGHALSVWRRDSGGTWRIETLLVNQSPVAAVDACPGLRPQQGG